MTLDALRVAYITPDETRLMLTLTLDNPNDRAVMVDALDFTLTVGGAAVASAVLTRPLALPAHGEAQAEIAAQATFASLSAALDAAVRERAVSYELAGRAIVDGRTLPFSRRGRKSFAELMGGPR